MKKIIALKGKSNSGKTSTFYVLGTMMQNAGYGLAEGNFLQKAQRISKRGDFWQVFEKHGKRIGVASAGDLYKIVKQQLTSLGHNHHCELILCTCRSFDKKKPGTIEAINEVVGYEKEFITKERASNSSEYDASNIQSAKQLLKALEKCFK